MKAINLLLGSIATALVITSGQTLRAEAQENWLREITGSYQSQIWSGGSIISGTTEFLLTNTNAVIGSYELEEQGFSSLGTLTQCQSAQVRTIECVWTDRYGSGAFEATFSEDYSRFDGHWRSGGDEQLTWNGSR